ncbi:hypothetical protein IU433_07285 [Nocardia puris]|uniref:Uncharacterized protein n=1 Tax=Nocardia puris TaxID=208602 RepID=A0A366DN95_9NOCA|nr:hypothetical protein [Nocardia puris]MBF6211341.1 hypothetical protein [Nocardia puris]MBF6365059.1 hypothetical protein [Nocardia puris]MBF6458844.1 hypothetical protein [Nocardia puris]RBO90698.1 hypothetical protein DFR74_105100 [Nocardia puris]
MSLTLDPVAVSAEMPCHHVRLLGVVERPRSWRCAVTTLFDSGLRRWSGRTDLAVFPPLRRWSRVLRQPTPPGHPDLAGALTAAASGRPLPEDPLIRFATAIMLLSGCPATATDFTPAPTVPDAPRTLDISLFALADDDLTMAEDLTTVALAAAGALTLRLDRTLHLPALPLTYPRAA